VENFERALILHALEKSGGVKKQGRQVTQFNRTTLVEKLKRLNLQQVTNIPGK